MDAEDRTALVGHCRGRLDRRYCPIACSAILWVLLLRNLRTLIAWRVELLRQLPTIQLVGCRECRSDQEYPDGLAELVAKQVYIGKSPGTHKSLRNECQTILSYLSTNSASIDRYSSTAGRSFWSLRLSCLLPSSRACISSRTPM